MYNFFPWVRVKILVTLLIDCLFVTYYIAIWNSFLMGCILVLVLFVFFLLVCCVLL